MSLHPHATRHTESVHRYLACLEAGDVPGLVALFSADARVYSPFLGWMAPEPFFTKVRDASGQSRIETLDVLASTQGQPRVAGYFTYHWQLKDGSQVRFDCVDMFDFDDDGHISRMVIVYDTAPIRADVGDKYA
jgi:ketosteroid isomerase-like protein